MFFTASAGVAEAGYKTWTPIGPSGIWVRALAVDPGTPANVYAGTAGEGIYVSRDGGVTWADKNLGLTGFYVEAFAVDPQRPTTVYAAAMPVNGWGSGVTVHRCVYKSVDRGDTWTPTGTISAPYLYLRDLAIEPSQPATVYAVGFGGVFKSTDGGARWTEKIQGLPERLVNTIAIDPLSSSTLYVGTEHDGVYKSIDGGENWSPANDGLTASGTGAVDELAVDAVTPSIVYAQTSDGIYKSTDGAANWIWKRHRCGPLLLDPSSPSTVWAGICRSTNGGDNWTRMDNGIGSDVPEPTALALAPSAPATLYAGIANGISKTADGGAHWAALTHTTLVDRYIQALAVVPPSPSVTTTLVASARSRGVHAYVKSGIPPWEESNAYLTNINVRALAVDSSNLPSALYVGTNGGGVFHADDNGVWRNYTWHASETGLTGTGARVVNALAVEPRTRSCYAGTYGAGVFKSTDRGRSWTPVNSGLLDGTAHVSALAADRGSSTVYAGTERGVYRSDDGGAGWAAANAGMSESQVHAIALDPIAPSTLYAAVALRGVFKSVDRGLSWNAVNTGLTHLNVNALATTASWRRQPGIQRAILETTLYAATDGGVFQSTNGGATWAAMSSGWPAGPGNSASALAIDPHDRTTLYAGTRRGVYQFQGQRLVPRAPRVRVEYLPR
jgi:hypothetical protein